MLGTEKERKKNKGINLGDDKKNKGGCGITRIGKCGFLTRTASYYTFNQEYQNLGGGGGRENASAMSANRCQGCQLCRGSILLCTEYIDRKGWLFDKEDEEEGKEREERAEKKEEKENKKKAEKEG